MTFTVKGVTFSHCYKVCPYFWPRGEVTGSQHIMTCEHPDAPGPDHAPDYKGYIISHPDCDTGFPKKCPLIARLV